MKNFKNLCIILFIFIFVLSGCQPDASLSQTNSAVQSASNASGSSSTTTSASDTTSTSSTSGKYSWPTQRKYMSSPYGMRTLNGSTRMHNGIDLAAPQGHSIVSPAAGRVQLAQYSSSAGNWIIIQHNNGDETVYMHCHQLHVRSGETVRAGQQIATVGNTGRSFGAHLHFEIRRSSERLDPPFYMIFAPDLTINPNLARNRVSHYSQLGYDI
ncbi:MAG: M23 family metallopeptidase [Candidatus Muiribacteriota bacterium]